MTTTPHGPTVPPTDPNDNPNPGDAPAGPRDGETFPLTDGAIIIPGKGHNGDDDDDDGNGSDGNHNNGNDKCVEMLEELVQRLGDLDAEAYCAAMLLGEIPRDPSPSAEVPMRRLWRMVERVANDIGAALQFAEAAVAMVRGSHGGSNGNGGVQS